MTCKLVQLVPCVVMASLTASCIELPDLDSPSEIERPRVIAIVAEPPEITPGESSRLSILIAGAEDYEVTWRACGSFDGFGNSAQYAAEMDDEGCSGRESLDLGRGASVELPGVLSATLFDNLDLASVVLGAQLPPELLEQVRSRVGLPFLIEATVRADGESLRAVKRVLLSERETPHQNPPAPAFRFGKAEVAAVDDEAFTCASLEAPETFVKTGARVELAPNVDGDEEAWLEMFEIIDARGDLLERKERAFYSWFSSAGSFDEDVTKSPLRDNRWRAPEQAGCHALWLVIRDGHGGASACKLEIAVGERGACTTEE